MDHMPDIFTKFFATPEDETSGFSRPGGFKGKAVSPYYLVKRLTEQFGLCGMGWGVTHHETKIVEAQNGMILVYVLLSVWYELDGKRYEVGPHYGGDVAVSVSKPDYQKKNLDGSFNMHSVDDEACKKAYTDAFSKCCSWLGLGGDVHDGFTDGKYTATKPWDIDPKDSIRKVKEDREKPKDAPQALLEEPKEEGPKSEAPLAAKAKPTAEEERKAKGAEYRRLKCEAHKILVGNLGGDESLADEFIQEIEKKNQGNQEGLFAALNAVIAAKKA